VRQVAWSETAHPHIDLCIRESPVSTVSSGRRARWAISKSAKRTHVCQNGSQDGDEAMENRANDPRPPHDATGNRANEPIAGTAMSGHEHPPTAGATRKCANEPIAVIAMSHTSHPCSPGATRKCANEPIAVIADRRDGQSCLTPCKSNASIVLKRNCLLGIRFLDSTRATGPCRLGRSDFGCGMAPRAGLGEALRRPSPCLNRPLASIRMDGWTSPAVPARHSRFRSA
jgi:hypothetical protein